jgi:hypothetical protein
MTCCSYKNRCFGGKNHLRHQVSQLRSFHPDDGSGTLLQNVDSYTSSTASFVVPNVKTSNLTIGSDDEIFGFQVGQPVLSESHLQSRVRLNGSGKLKNRPTVDK